MACDIDDREGESPSPMEPRTGADVPQLGDRSPPSMYFAKGARTSSSRFRFSRGAACYRSDERHPSTGGETHERSIRSGCSPAVQDGATEIVATGSARHANSRKATPLNMT